MRKAKPKINPNCVRFGAGVRSRRTELGYSIKESAIDASISDKFWANIEQGRDWPSLPTYFRMCRALHVGTVPLAV